MEPPGAAAEGEASEQGYFFASAGALRLSDPRRSAPGWASVVDVAAGHGIAAFSDGNGALISVVQPPRARCAGWRTPCRRAMVVAAWY